MPELKLNDLIKVKNLKDGPKYGHITLIHEKYIQVMIYDYLNRPCYKMCFWPENLNLITKEELPQSIKRPLW